MARPRPFGSPSCEASRGPVTHGLIGPSPARGRASPGRGGWLTGPRRLGGTGPTCGGGGEARCPLRGTSQFWRILRTVEQRRRLRTEEGVEFAE